MRDVSYQMIKSGANIFFLCDFKSALPHADSIQLRNMTEKVVSNQNKKNKCKNSVETVALLFLYKCYPKLKTYRYKGFFHANNY